MILMLFFFFFRLYFCHFFLCHVSFVIVTGVRGSKKIISFVIPFPFLLLHVALDCGLPFFEVSPPLFICHVILNHLQSIFLLFLFFFSICLAQLSVTCICIVMVITCSYVLHFLFVCFKDTYTMTFLDFFYWIGHDRREWGIYG